MAKRPIDPIARWLPLLAVVILASVAVAILYFGQMIFVPLALGIILAFLLQPFVRLFERRGVPRVPAVAITVLLISVVLIAVGGSVGGQLRELAGELRSNQTYISNLESKVVDLRRFVGGGVMADLQAILDRVGSNLEGSEADKSNESAILVRTEAESQLTKLMATVSPLMGPLGTMSLAVALVIFMLISREDLRNRIIGVFGHGQLSVTTRALNIVGRRIGRYLMMQFVINASYGLALGLVLLLVGVPFALLWGLLAAILRYVPYVGPLLGAIFPVVTSLVAFEGWSQPFVVIAFIVALEFLSNMVMEPVLFGHSVGISAVGLVMSAGFWTLLWGPVGLVMATPLTVCLVVVGQHVPQFRFFAVLLGDEPALAPRMRYYQRLLARDQHEAASLVKALMRESHQLSQICDQVLLPALVRTRKDRMRELIAAEDEAFVLQATRDIVNELTQSHSSIKGELLGGFGTAATAGQPCVAANGHVAATATLGSTDDTNDVEQASKPRLCILGCPSHHEAEEAAIHMLSAVLVDHGYNLHVLP